MKKNFINFISGSLILFSTASGFAATDANLYPSNLGGNTYFDSYDNNTKIISGINFSSLSDGTSNTLSTNPFKIKLYLLVKGTTTNPIYVKTIDVANGQKHVTEVQYKDLTVDLKAITGLASGTYRMGIYVDADKNVTESNEDDNFVLFGGDIVYSAPAQAKSDLQIANVTYQVNSTKTVLTNFSVTISNKGVAASTATEMAIRIEDTNTPGEYFEATVDISAIDANSSETIALEDMDISQDFNPQTVYKLTAIIDPNEMVAESNEDNNSKLVSNNMYQGPLAVGLGSDNEQANLFLTTSNQINLHLVNSETVELTILDMRGNIVSTLVNETLPAGNHVFNSSNAVQAGQLYLCKLSTNKYSMVKKMAVLD
ncbi:MAG TPA: CARDB domain-containing protein [Cytophagaceae bacterium]